VPDKRGLVDVYGAKWYPEGRAPYHSPLRWPHGYAYEYNPLFDPDWSEGNEPHAIGRAPFGRITIANSDAGAAAYTDSAIDQAYRAVQELFRA
jgi:spermidine dehydrogenase